MSFKRYSRAYFPKYISKRIFFINFFSPKKKTEKMKKNYIYEAKTAKNIHS